MFVPKLFPSFEVPPEVRAIRERITPGYTLSFF
jgi:hypothetical protein